jgi:uncharacterized protein YdcH (DUF465 family)
MSAGAVFSLIANDGKADRMIMATRLLNDRIRDTVNTRDPRETERPSSQSPSWSSNNEPWNWGDSTPEPSSFSDNIGRSPEWRPEQYSPYPYSEHDSYGSYDSYEDDYNISMRLERTLTEKNNEISRLHDEAILLQDEIKCLIKTTDRKNSIINNLKLTLGVMTVAITGYMVSLNSDTVSDFISYF